MQPGEASVVSPEPGEIPERNSLDVLDGEVVRITRDRPSTLVQQGEVVLSDEQLRELGELMWHIDHNYPVDREGRDPEQIVLDLEFKFDHDGSLVVKQVRPFLLSVDLPPMPMFELEVPEGTEACAQFSILAPGKEPIELWENKARLLFAAGSHDLPTGQTTFSIELIQELRFGQAEEVLQPAGPGLVSVERRVERRGEGGDLNTFVFSLEQRFMLPDGRTVTVVIRPGSLRFQARGEMPVGDAVRLDTDLLGSRDTVIEIEEEGVPIAQLASCTGREYPLWSIEADLDNGDSVRLLERFLPPDFNESEASGHAVLVRVAGSCG